MAINWNDTFRPAVEQSVQNAVGGLLGGQSYFDQYGNIDVTAPGRSYSTSDLAEASRGYIEPSLAAAENIYAAGRPDLNPLLQSYYDQTAALVPQAEGVDPRTQQLADRAAQAAGGAFGSAGTLGSARANQAAANAAAEVIADRQRQARQDLATAGTQYQDWQTGADFDWLNRFQGAVQAAPQGGQTTTNYLSGADILTAQVNRDILEAHLANALGEQGTRYTSGDNWYDPVLEAGAGAVVGGITGGVTDWIGSFFNDGGEVKKDDWF